MPFDFGSLVQTAHSNAANNVDGIEALQSHQSGDKIEQGVDVRKEFIDALKSRNYSENQIDVAGKTFDESMAKNDDKFDVGVIRDVFRSIGFAENGSLHNANGEIIKAELTETETKRVDGIKKILEGKPHGDILNRVLELVHASYPGHEKEAEALFWKGHHLELTVPEGKDIQDVMNDIIKLAGVHAAFKGELDPDKPLLGQLSNRDEAAGKVLTTVVKLLSAGQYQAGNLTNEQLKEGAVFSRDPTIAGQTSHYQPEGKKAHGDVESLQLHIDLPNDVTKGAYGGGGILMMVHEGRLHVQTEGAGFQTAAQYLALHGAGWVASREAFGANNTGIGGYSPGNEGQNNDLRTTIPDIPPQDGNSD